jgi:hypothetical protein
VVGPLLARHDLDIEFSNPIADTLLHKRLLKLQNPEWDASKTTEPPLTQPIVLTDTTPPGDRQPAMMFQQAKKKEAVILD